MDFAVKPYRFPSGIRVWDGSAGNSVFCVPPIYPAKLQTPPWRSFAVITIGKGPFAAWACRKQQALEHTMDDLRTRFGDAVVKRGILLTDPAIGLVNPKDDHTIHPVGYFAYGIS